MRYYSDRELARAVQVRLQANGIHVHNAVTRAAVGHVLDLIGEMEPTQARMFLDLTRNHSTPPIRDNPELWRRLKRAYSKRIKGERGLRIWAALHRLMPTELLKPSEVIVLVDIRRDLVRRGDRAGVKVIDKMLTNMRRI